MLMSPTDHEEIRQLLARYNFAIDLGDVTGWAACFTEDGVFECSGLADGNPLGGRHEGTEALRAYATTHFGIAKGRARHWNGSIQIDGDGDRATMRCYLLAIVTGAPGAATTGIYRDRLRKVSGRWLFTERHVSIDEQPPRD
jgi:ketosteroid isomerase-like protein